MDRFYYSDTLASMLTLDSLFKSRREPLVPRFVSLAPGLKVANIYKWTACPVTVKALGNGVPPSEMVLN